MNADDLHQVEVGKTRVRHIPSGDTGTAISPLPPDVRSRATVNLIVQFDGEDQYSSVTSVDLGVVR